VKKAQKQPDSPQGENSSKSAIFTGENASFTLGG